MRTLGRLGCLLCGWLVFFSAQAHWQGNWLVGVTGGYSQHNGNIPIEINYTAIPNYPQTNLLWDGRGKEWTKGLVMGYRSICNRWLFDGEFNVDLYQPDSDFYFQIIDIGNVLAFDGKRRYKHGPGFGISARFGYVMSPFFIPYMVAGVETNKDKLEVTLSPDQAIYPFAIVMQDHKQQLRGILGFGAEFPIIAVSPCLSVRLEYNYHTMDRALTLQGAISDGGVLNPNFAMSLRPKFNSGKAALIWNFE